MKKSFKYLLLLLGLVVVTTSCENTQVSSGEGSDNLSNSEEISDINSEINSESNSQIDEDSYYQIPDWPQENYKCSVGLTDLGVSRSLVTGEEYNLQIQFNDTRPNPDNEQYISSNPDVVTVEKDEEGQIIIKCHHAGKAAIRILDGNGDIRYCEIVRVADPIDLKDMEDHLVYNCNEWLSLIPGMDEYTITFFPGNEYTIVGLDQYGGAFATVNGTYEYVETLNVSGITEYTYTFTDENAKSLQLEGFNVDITGEFMHLRGSNITVNMLYPDFRKSDFESFIS